MKDKDKDKDKKICGRCNEEKPLDDFYKNRTCKDGHSRVCKKCQNEITIQWRASRENKDRQNMLARKRYRKRCEELKVLRKWAEEHGFNKNNN